MVIGICGLGNLGKGVARALKKYPDIKCTAIFSRREALKEYEGIAVYPFCEIENFKDKIDVLIAAMSSDELKTFSPYLSKHFNIVESFDKHEQIKEHFMNVDYFSRENNKVSLISGGWDPGLFSFMRLISSAFNPCGECFTFWGEGVSQGHSNALRSVEGIKDAIEYTIPNKKAIEAARKGNFENIDRSNMHRRQCYVSLEDWADKKRTEEKIKNIDGYFKGYETDVDFVSSQEIKKRREKMPHGGIIISNYSNNKDGALMEFSLKLNSNPDFTAGILLSLARAVYVMKNSGDFGAKTVFDIKPKWLIMGEDTLKFL